MSAKITVRELDGTEYQLKKRIGQMVVDAGFARKVKRGLIEMISRPLSYALRVVTSDGDGKLKPEGPPSCTLATYPARDQTSNPRPFGSGQDWSYFPA